MLQHDAALGQALGARGAHVVGREDLQHRAARMPHEHRGDRVAEHEGRHDQRGQVAPPVVERADIARCRQPAKRHREQQDQHDAEPEIRRRQSPKRDDVRGVVPRGIALHRGHDPGRNADRERDDDRQERELERHRQLLEDELEHRLAQAHRFAQVSLYDAPYPVAVPHGQRIVEMELLVEVGHDAGIAVLAGEHQRRIAGQQLLQAEDQHRHEDERRHDRGDAADEERQHRSARWRSTPRFN